MSAVRLVILAALLVGLTPVAEAMVWQPAPQKPHAGRMAAKMLHLEGGEGAQAYLIHPDLERQALGIIDQQGMLKFKPSGKENYHALLAIREQDKLTEVAIRYLFLHGKPTGNSPSELTHSDKVELEIVPNPLPREHWRYASNQEVAFIVRFRGQPLANFPVTVSTSNGSSLKLKTAQDGRLHVRVPDDFKVVNVGRRNNPPAEWQIRVEHENGGFQFRTSLSADYLADSNHWQPLSWGLVAMAGGMLVTGALTIRRRPQKTARTTRKKAKE